MDDGYAYPRTPMNQRFYGHYPRECGPHQPAGPRRAYCPTCEQWCYPDDACRGCQPAEDTCYRSAIGIMIHGPGCPHEP